MDRQRAILPGEERGNKSVSHEDQYKWKGYRFGGEAGTLGWKDRKINFLSTREEHSALGNRLIWRKHLPIEGSGAGTNWYQERGA